MMEAFVRQAYFVCAISFLFFVATLHFFEKKKIVQKDTWQVYHFKLYYSCCFI